MTNEQYYELIKPYEDASRVLSTRLEILNHSLYGDRSDAGPIHNIQGRIKEKKSMESKLVRLGFTAGVTNARNHLQDIAGLRIICYFVEDIYNLTAALKKQSDLVIIKEKDYIRNAKPNGYRSYHIVLGIPVYFLDTMEYFRWRCSFGPWPWISGPAWNTGYAIRNNPETGSGWNRISAAMPGYWRRLKGNLRHIMRGEGQMEVKQEETRRTEGKRVEGKTIFAMSSSAVPVCRAGSHETVTFVTKDCFDNQFTEEGDVLDSLNWDCINPATGPIYVEGAMPGDVLKVKIEDIRVASWGTMAAIPDNGVLGDCVSRGTVKRIPVRDGVAWFNQDIGIPCAPMIGVIGVAPEKGEIPCGEPGSHGGNMDNTKIKAGATLYLPVFHEGALLAMGDVHACMGDGEIMVTGLEIPAEVTVTLEVLKGISIDNPMLEDGEACYTIASHENVETAVYTAVKAMTDILMRELGMSLEDAGMLLSAMGNLQFCQVVDPKRTVRMEMKKTVLKKLF